MNRQPQNPTAPLSAGVRTDHPERSIILNMKQRTFLTGLLALTLPAVAGQHLTDAQVRKIDKEGAKITLKHGAIKNLDTPAMTMVFTVQDKALLDRVQKDDKVKFAAKHEGGKYVVTELEVTK
jgi:Cu(I)/Ag(I) efflux system protein CusF